MWVTAGFEYNIPIDFTVGGEFVIPTTASIIVRDNAGSVILSSVLSSTGTSTFYTVPALNNALTGGRVLEYRHYRVTFLSAGKTYYQAGFYRITAFIPFSATAQEVRNELGLEQSELPDAHIDLTSAYHSLLSSYGPGVTSALTAGDVTALAVNQAIAVTAAWAIVTSLPFRANVKMKAENSEVSRMASFDVDVIGRRLSAKIGTLMATVFGTSFEFQTHFVLVTPVDVITGA